MNLFSRRRLLSGAAGLLSVLGLGKLLSASPRVEFCNWCPDPKHPWPEHHPDGQVRHDPVAVDTNRLRWTFGRNVDVQGDEVCIGGLHLTIQINAIDIVTPELGRVTRSWTYSDRSTDLYRMRDDEPSSGLDRFKGRCLMQIDRLAQYELNEGERKSLASLREAIEGGTFFKDAYTKIKLQPNVLTAMWSDPIR